MHKNYFQTSYIRIWYDETSKAGAAVWEGKLTSEQFREALQRCFLMIPEKKLVNWIGDKRKLNAASAEDQEWAHQFIPFILNSGLQKMATINSEDIYLQTGRI